VNLAKPLIPTAIPVLLEILSDIPFIECANDLTWDGELALARTPTGQ
jgi:hypothetical protein